ASTAGKRREVLEGRALCVRVAIEVIETGHDTQRRRHGPDNVTVHVHVVDGAVLRETEGIGIDVCDIGQESADDVERRVREGHCGCPGGTDVCAVETADQMMWIMID